MAHSAAEVIRPLRRAEYDQLAALGAFQDERVELLDGALVAMSPIGVAHNSTVQKLNRLLVLAFEGRAAVRCQSSFAANAISEPEPDFVIAPPGEYDVDHPTEAYLIIEVADSYSPLGYLISGKLPTGITFSYSYDGFGRRIQKVVGTVTTRYVYRDGLHPIAVLDGNGALLSRFVYGARANVPELMALPDGSVFRIISDQLGSPRVIVSASGTPVQKIDYDEFGVRTVVSDTGAFSARAQPFGFAGGLYDLDTGLVHFGARDCDPQVGRWISRDPILFGGGQANLYVYAGNSPVDLSDPRGTDVCRMSTDEGYHHEWVDIDGHTYGFWPAGISGSLFLDASRVYSPDPHENDGSRSAVCTASTPDEDRELEAWIDKTYQPNRTNRSMPYSFGSQDCRGFQDSVMDKLADIQGVEAPWKVRFALLPEWWVPFVYSWFQ